MEVAHGVIRIRERLVLLDDRHDVGQEDANCVDERPIVDTDGSSLHGTGTTIVSAEDHTDIAAIYGFRGLKDGTGVGELVRSVVTCR